MKKVTINKDGHYEFDETPAVIQPFSIHLEKLRDQEADRYGKSLVPQDGFMNQREFKAGWDARDAIAKEREAKLVEALEFYANKDNFKIIANEFGDNKLHVYESYKKHSIGDVGVKAIEAIEADRKAGEE